MTVFTVSSAAALLSAVKQAKSGDVIQLKNGVYSNLDIKNINIAGDVTITSADPDNRAQLTDLRMTNCSGFNISNIEFVSFTEKNKGSVSIVESRDIHFDNVEVHGPEGLGAASRVSMFGFRASTDVSVTNSEFHDMQFGIGLRDTSGAVISGNSFHHIRTDGIRGGGNSDLTISGNLFTNFTPAPGDHADAIQLWTKGITLQSKDVTISDNLVIRGEGSPIQGVFLRDDAGDLPFERVTINGNLVVGSNYNGISLDGGRDSEINGNTIVSFANSRSWVRVDNSDDVSLSGNIANFFMARGHVAGALANNVLNQTVDDRGAAAATAWLKANPDFTGAWGSAAGAASFLGLAPPPPPPPPPLAAIALNAIAGTAGTDKLVAEDGTGNRIDAGAGDDWLTGNATHKNDLIGGSGNDTYAVKGLGDRVIEAAGGGEDTVTTALDYTLTDNVENLRMSGGGKTGTGNALDNRIIGSADGDTIRGLDGNDTVQGQGGDDKIFGGNGDDDLRGDAGNDTIHGDAGRDTITGGAGNDTIHGGDGNDAIEGGAGSDIMTGGAGADSFRFRQADIGSTWTDTITDFVRGEDSIYLRSLDARIDTIKDDAFHFIGQSGFTGTAGELRYEVKGGNSLITGDINGDGVSDFSILVQGHVSLSANDFNL